MQTKTVRHFLPGALIMAGLLGAHPAHAEVLTLFNFNDRNLVSDGGLRSSTITSNFISTDIDAMGTGTTGASGDSALQIFNTAPDGTGPNQGKYIQFGLNTTGYRNLNVTFATQNFQSGFTSGQFQYSNNNGSTFTNLTTPYTPTVGAYGSQTFDLSNISSINNNANAAFRIVFSGGSTTSAQAGNYIDNLTVNATAVAPVPEPSSWAMMALGMGALGVIGWKRKRSD